MDKFSPYSYYYKPTGCEKGNKPSRYTFNKITGWVEEQTVVESIKAVLSRPFLDCGYHLMTEYLRRDGYVINHKKVYRIVDYTKLLKSKFLEIVPAVSLLSLLSLEM